MQSRLLRRWTKPVIHAGLATMMVSTTAMADDTDVFTSQIASSLKPNLLFVLDYSGSMNDWPKDKSIRTSKIKILKAAVRQLMIDNEGIINAGLGSLYDETPSGVQWPISDLAMDAHYIDQNIPLGKTTVRQVISQQLDTREAGKATATVDALAEAASYFRGGAVYRNGVPTNQPEWFRPDVWNNNLGRYNNGDLDAAIASSYDPSDAYKATGQTGGIGICRDYSVNGKYRRRDNECSGKNYSVTRDCDLIPERTWYSNGGWRNRPEYYNCEYKRTDKWTGAKYISPIKQECQINAVILISDGVPTIRNNDSEIVTSIGNKAISTCEDLTTTFPRSASDAKPIHHHL